MNIVEHVSLLLVGTSSGYMPRRGIVGSSRLISREVIQVCNPTNNGGARESTQGAEGVCNPIGGTTI